MANETFELRIQGMHVNEYTENVLHFQSNGTDPNDTLVSGINLLDGWIANMQTLWLAMLPATYFLQGYAARRATPKPSSVAKAQFGAAAVPGTRGSTGESNQLCPEIFLVPSAGTKSGGKIFLPCVAQGDISGNVKVAGYNTAILNFISALISGFTQSGITWASVVYSRKLHTTSTTINAHTTPLVGYQKVRRSPTGI